jgi:hypothetical protein
VNSLIGSPRDERCTEWIWTDLTRPENDESWAALAEMIRYGRRIELFDMCGGYSPPPASAAKSHPLYGGKSCERRMRSLRRASVASTCNADGTGKAQVRLPGADRVDMGRNCFSRACASIGYGAWARSTCRRFISRLPW